LGKRFDAKESLSLRLVDVIAPEKSVLNAALEIANKIAEKGSDKKIVASLKEETYKWASHELLHGGFGAGIPKSTL
jgi:enoyl-CoA hydratase/carnithine racemase